MPGLLHHLNNEQRRAVEYADGPLLVLAGPGTGKTRVITHRIAHQVSSGVAPERILGVTFTNRAAEEMKNRVSDLVENGDRVRLGTFHWLAHALLRRYSSRLGLASDFRLLGGSEARRALREAIPASGAEFARIAAAIHALKNGAAVPDAGRDCRLDARSLSSALETYDLYLRRRGAIDLDDLIRLAVRLLDDDDETREKCSRTYSEVLVDEYQDTNPMQQKLLSLLRPEDGTVVAVGDEDQSIYGWRQADARGVHRFLQNFPEAEVVRLQSSYRSSKRILRAAGSLIEHNPGRLGLALRTDNPAGETPVCYVADDEGEEAEWVAAEIERMVQRAEVSHEGVAILYRVNAQSRAIEDALARHRIPYHIHAGDRFYQRQEIRCVMAYLRLALDADDDAARYLASLIPGIGPVRLERLQHHAGSDPLLTALHEPPSFIPREVARRLRSTAEKVERVRDALARPLDEVIAVAIAGVAEDLDANPGSDSESARENLQELRSAVRGFDSRRAGLRDLVDRLSLGAVSGERGGGVTLMTLHAAKGLEFDVVFMPGLEEGLLPHRRSLERGEVEEERRLCYVGITRARKSLYLSYTHMRLLGGQALLGHPSRFVGEIGTDNLDLRLSPRRREKPRLASVAVGDRVVHPRWDAGTVISVEGQGRDTLVTIAFDGSGRQRLQLCHAPLERAVEVGELAG